MPELAEGREGVLARIAAVKAEFEAVQAQLQACDCEEEAEAPSPEGGHSEVERLREAVHAMERASETYEQRKKSLEAQNAQMLSEIHEFEFIRSRLKKIVQEESAGLDEQGCCADDEDAESQPAPVGLEADRDQKLAPVPA